MDSSNALMTPASGAINSRFESQNSIEETRENRKKEWAEAYARIGQKPPPEEPSEEYDARTLFERLEAQKEIKKEEWDARMKLSNQWRGLDADEKRFLAEKEAEKREEQRKLEQAEAEEVKKYKERLAARQAAVIDTPPAPPSLAPPRSSSKKTPSKDIKKNVKSLMKGIVVKKKPKTTTLPITSPITSLSSSKVDDTENTISTEPAIVVGAKRAASDEDIGFEDDKRLKSG
ncbi:hypothetical protein L204_102925 [Cryptococcus depauperatus]|nr:hypothetical protein L204_00326 [Cryptococcus depauperatus CBS 7855]